MCLCGHLGLSWLTDGLSVPGCAGDAGAHNSTLNDAANPTVALTHWCRDRERGDQIPLKLMVNKQTKATAHHFGFTDRGTLEVGMKVTPDRLRTTVLPQPHTNACRCA